LARAIAMLRLASGELRPLTRALPLDQGFFSVQFYTKVQF